MMRTKLYLSFLFIIGACLLNPTKAQLFEVIQDGRRGYINENWGTDRPLLLNMTELADSGTDSWL